MNDLVQRIEDMFDEVSPDLGTITYVRPGLPYVVYGIITPSVEQCCNMLLGTFIAKRYSLAVMVPEGTTIPWQRSPKMRLHWRVMPEISVSDVQNIEGPLMYSIRCRCAMEVIE